MEKEIWKDIPGYEGIYKASSLGRIKSIDRIVRNKTNIKGVILRLAKDTDGYGHVKLYAKGKSKKTYKIHKLIALAFIPNPQNKETVNHIDGDKTNNYVLNLEWATRSEQSYHAYSIGLSKPMIGVLHTKAKLSDDKVRQIRILRASGLTQTKLALMFGVHQAKIWRILSGKDWSHVS